MNKRPLIITFFGTINLLTAFFSLLLTIGSIFPGFLESVHITKMQLPFFDNNIICIFLYVFQVVVAIGLLKLKGWGYWLTMSYQIFFIVIFIFGYIENKTPFLFTSVALPFFEVLFILPTKGYFICERVAS